MAVLSGMRDLDHRERKFLEAYLDCGNATEAALLAGYDLPSRRVASQKGSELLKRPHIQAELEAKFEEWRQRYDHSRENIISEVAKIAFADIRDVFVTETDRDKDGNIVSQRVKVDLSRLDAVTARAIAEIRHDKNGNPIIKMHSKLGALELLARIEKLMVDRVEIENVTDPMTAIREARARARLSRQHSEDVFDANDDETLRLEAGHPRPEG